jgi:hypothetical protein
MDARNPSGYMTSEEREQRKVLKAELAGHKLFHMLAFEARAVRAFGADAGIFCRQLLFWDGKGKDPLGFIWKTEEDWRNEVGLNRNAQRRARKTLKAKGVLEEEHRGVPRRLWFRLDLERLIELVGAYADKTDTGETDEQEDWEEFDDIPF